jgi:hypothetical protein
LFFGIPKITIADAKYSPYLLAEAEEFRETQKRLFRSSYPTMTGCLLAHEGAADDMLINFKKFIFNPYRGYYTEEQFKKLIKYYDAHRDDSQEEGNVEEQHEEQALQIASEMIATNPRSEKLISEGGKKFLDAQDKLWSEMMRAIENSKSHGQRVIPKDKFLIILAGESQEVTNTNPSSLVKTGSAKKAITSSAIKQRAIANQLF